MDDQPIEQQIIYGERDIKLIIAIIVALALIFTISLFFNLKAERGNVSTPSETTLHTFPEIDIEAKAAYIYDIHNQAVLFSKNEDLRLPLASLTKIMLALVAKELSPENSVVTINTQALSSEGDNGLLNEEKWFLKDLLDFSLISSSNDGVRAVALALGALSQTNLTDEEIIKDFVNKMNIKAGELGLEGTHFWNETGLDLDTGAEDESLAKGGAYGTVEDTSRLLEYVLRNYPELLIATKEPVATFHSLNNLMHVAENTNIITSEIPGLLASKTGFTDSAGGNLAIIFDPELGRPIVISILGSTEQGRFKDVKILIDAVMEYINQ